MSEAAVEPSDPLQTFRQRLRDTEVPSFYRPWLHGALTMGIVGLVMVLMITRLHDLRPAEWLAFPAFFLMNSLLEYCEHRWLLHRRVPGAAMAYQIHTLVHHRFFTDADFEPEQPADVFYILFPPRIVVAFALVVMPAVTLLFSLISWNVGLAAGITSGAFFLMYEVIHGASHLARDSVVGRLPGLAWLIRHHRLHHDPRRMGRVNFNIVVPIFDIAFGTLVTA